VAPPPMSDKLRAFEAKLPTPLISPAPAACDLLCTAGGTVDVDANLNRYWTPGLLFSLASFGSCFRDDGCCLCGFNRLALTEDLYRDPELEGLARRFIARGGQVRPHCHCCTCIFACICPCVVGRPPHGTQHHAWTRERLVTVHVLEHFP
jgi:hypothetical protein